MPRAFPLVALLAGLLAGSEDYRCGYGGPGCGEPRLAGACHAIVQTGGPVELTAEYTDDTGGHATTVQTAAVDDETVLTLTALAGREGVIELTGLAPGMTRIALDVEGWERAYHWTFTVTDAPAPACAKGEAPVLRPD